MKLTETLKLKRWQILKVEPFESRNDTVITLTIGAIEPPSLKVITANNQKGRITRPFSLSVPVIPPARIGL